MTSTASISAFVQPLSNEGGRQCFLRKQWHKDAELMSRCAPKNGTDVLVSIAVLCLNIFPLSLQLGTGTEAPCYAL